MLEQNSTLEPTKPCSKRPGGDAQGTGAPITSATGISIPTAPEQALDFIALLTGSPQTEVTLQLIPDVKTGDAGQPAIHHYSLGSEPHFAWVARENREFRKGVFVTVNETDLLGRKVSNIVALRALFVDDDKNQLSPDDQRLTGCPPSFSVRSKRGWHHYWLLVKDQPLSAFSGAQMSLAASLGTDMAVKDLPRVMRVPGFLHLKNPAEPFLVELLPGCGRRYTIAEVVQAYPAPAHLIASITAVAAREVAGRRPAVQCKQGLHAAAPDQRFIRKLLAALLIHPLVRWICENGESVSYELWRATATNIAAACEGDAALLELGRKLFHRISSSDGRYRAGGTDTAWVGAIDSVGSYGPVTFTVMIAAGAPEELCASPQRSLVADARLRLVHRMKSRSRRHSF